MVRDVCWCSRREAEGVEGTQMKTAKRNVDGQKKVVIIGQQAQKMNLEPSSTLFILPALQKKPLKCFKEQEEIGSSTIHAVSN